MPHSGFRWHTSAVGVWEDHWGPRKEPSLFRTSPNECPQKAHFNDKFIVKVYAARWLPRTYIGELNMQLVKSRVSSEVIFAASYILVQFNVLRSYRLRRAWSEITRSLRRATAVIRVLMVRGLKTLPRFSSDDMPQNSFQWHASVKVKYTP